MEAEHLVIWVLSGVSILAPESERGARNRGIVPERSQRRR